jgi:hypothetical protein
MVVKTQSTGRSVTGLNAGAKNIQRNFPKSILAIELQLDYLQIQCGLEPDFWLDQPEIHDPSICTWLELKYPYGNPGRGPVPLTMIPAGKNSSRLLPISLRAHAESHMPQGAAA